MHAALQIQCGVWGDGGEGVGEEEGEGEGEGGEGWEGESLNLKALISFEVN